MKSLISKVVVCLIILATCFSGIFVAIKIIEDKGMPTEEQVEAKQENIVKQMTDEDAVAGAISTAHQTLNDLAGWGNDAAFIDNDDVAWEERSSDFGTVDMYLTTAINRSTGDLKKDLILAKKMNAFALARGDHDALLYTHRILHDLDNAINGDVHKGVFNSARMGVGSGSKVDYYERYVKK